MIKARLAILAGALLAACTMAQAASTTSCRTGSFGSYMADGMCSIGSLDFYNFELFTLDPSNSATAADSSLLAAVIMHPTWNSTTGTATLVIDGFTPFTVGATETRAWRIHFTVDPPPIIRSEDVSLDPPFGDIVADELECADALITACAAGAHDQTFDNASHPHAHYDFSPTVAELDLITSVRLNPNFESGGVASGFDGLVFVVETVPEPGTWMMMLLPLAGIVARKRFRRN